MFRVYSVAPDGLRSNHWQVYDQEIARRLAARVKVPAGHVVYVEGVVTRTIVEVVGVERIG